MKSQVNNSCSHKIKRKGKTKAGAILNPSYLKIFNVANFKKIKSQKCVWVHAIVIKLKI